MIQMGEILFFVLLIVISYILRVSSNTYILCQLRICLTTVKISPLLTITALSSQLAVL